MRKCTVIPSIAIGLIWTWVQVFAPTLVQGTPLGVTGEFFIPSFEVGGAGSYIIGGLSLINIVTVYIPIFFVWKLLTKLGLIKDKD